MPKVTAKGFLSTPYKHRSAINRRARTKGSSLEDTVIEPGFLSQASTSFSANWRQASTKKAPEPIAGSHTFKANICSGVGLSPMDCKTGLRVSLTIDSVSDRGV